MENNKRYCVKENYTIKEVLECFEEKNDRVAIVINDDENVIGVVSQGDILRALSSGTNLYTNVNKIIASEFLHLYERDMEKAYKIFKSRKISLLPVLDENSKLCDVITLNDIFTYMESLINK